MEGLVSARPPQLPWYRKAFDHANVVLSEARSIACPIDRLEAAMSWVDRYRDSVSWGDEIHSDDGDRSCWVVVDGVRRYARSGYFQNRERACRVALARAHQLQTSHMRVMWLDDRLTAAQVENGSFSVVDYGIVGLRAPAGEPPLRAFDPPQRGRDLARAAEKLGSAWDKGG